MANSNFFEWWFSPAGRHANVRQSLPQRTRSAQQNIAIDLFNLTGIRINLERNKNGKWAVWEFWSFTRSELLLPRVWPATVGLSGKEREFDLVVHKGGARGDPYPGKVFKPNPDPRLDAAATVWAIFKFEQNDILDFLRELCRSNVFCAENGDGRTRYLNEIKGNRQYSLINSKSYKNLLVLI